MGGHAFPSAKRACRCTLACLRQCYLLGNIQRWKANLRGRRTSRRAAPEMARVLLDKVGWARWLRAPLSEWIDFVRN
eukprot:12923465-Prorocentrum_lima.AAC.1